MKKWICGLLVILLVTVYVHAAYAAAHAGVLHIPDANISVSLYESSAQSVVDAENSAACFWWQGWIIADHNNQAFRTLRNVQVGDEAIIYQPSGQTIHLKCVYRGEGRNTGHDLTVDGKSLFGRYDYLMYTCKNKAVSRKGIILTGWEVTKQHAFSG